MEKSFNLKSKETGLIEFTGSYDDCLFKRTELIKEEGGQTSSPNDYYLVEKVKEGYAILGSPNATFFKSRQSAIDYINEHNNGKDVDMKEDDIYRTTNAV